MTKREIEFENSGGNVFADLGLDEADELYTRAALGAQAVKILQGAGLHPSGNLKTARHQATGGLRADARALSPFQPKAADRLLEQAEFESDHSNQPSSGKRTLSTGFHRAIAGF
jgi:hypothetical protein